MTDKKKPSDIFRAMADRLDRNDPAEFAGAYLIIAPDGTSVSQAFVNPVGDQTAFWGFVSAQVQVAQSEAIQKEESRYGIGGNRGR